MRDSGSPKMNRQNSGRSKFDNSDLHHLSSEFVKLDQFNQDQKPFSFGKPSKMQDQQRNILPQVVPYNGGKKVDDPSRHK